MAAYVTVSIGESARTARPLIASRDEAVVEAVMRALQHAIDGKVEAGVGALRRGRSGIPVVRAHGRRGQG